jgi:hypothetical protein
MNNLKIDQAMAYVRKLSDKNNGDVPDWNKYQELVKAELSGPYDPKYKMPQEYYYAYLRGKGMTHAECLERMGIAVRKEQGSKEKKSFWKFW